MSSKKNSAKTRKPQKNALQAITFAIIAVLVCLAFLTVELRPVKSVPTWISTEESFALATMSSKLLNTMRQKHSSREFCSITLSPAEINSVIRILLRIYDNSKKPGEPLLYIMWENACANTECSFKVCGIYFNFYLQIVPSLRQEKLYLRVDQCRLGKLPLPAKMAEKVLNEELEKQLQKEQRLQDSLSLLHSLEAEKSGEIKIEFLRKNTGSIIRSFF